MAKWANPLLETPDSHIGLLVYVPAVIVPIQILVNLQPEKEWIKAQVPRPQSRRWRL